MKIKVAHHIFASREGYQTQFRSPDVTDSENGELESFSFGQTNDANYMASLKKHPAFTVRKLQSGRWAITRVFQGVDDDYGRATLRFHTVLVSQREWASFLDFDILPILEHPTVWEDTESTEISVERDDSPLPQDIAEQVLLLLNQLTGSSSPMIVDESACSLQIVRWVHRRLLDEDKEEFSYGYRVLSDAMDASLLCLANQALRTATSSSKSHASASSPVEDSDYENMNMDYDPPASSNMLAILIIITVCVVGIAGAIFALVKVTNARNENTISGKIKRANDLLEKSYSIIADPNGLESAKGKIEKLLNEIDKLPFKAPELESKRGELETWESEETQARILFEQFQNLKNRLAKEQLKPVSPSYPTKIKIDRVIAIENEFLSVWEKDFVESDSSSLGVFKNEDNNVMSDGVQQSLNIIKWWEYEIESLIVADTNAVEEIDSILNETDPNQYTWADPNQINFDDPNLPTWMDPKQFSHLAQQDILKLTNEAKQKIARLLRDPSLRNAKNSPIPIHKNWASDYEAELKSLQSLVNHNIEGIRILKPKADTIKRIEKPLTSKGNAKPTLQSALNQYDKRLNTELTNPEKIWLHHFKLAILKFYVNNIRSDIEARKIPDHADEWVFIKGYYEMIKGASLNSETVFESLYDYYKELEGQQKQKESPAKSIPKSKRNGSQKRGK